MYIQQNRFRRPTALFLALLLFGTVCLAIGFSCAETGHSCTGHDCPVCLQICLLRILLRQLMPFGVIAATLTGFIWLHARIPFPHRMPYSAVTPISLCTRMND